MRRFCMIPVFNHAATAPAVRTHAQHWLGKFEHADSISPATDEAKTMTGSLPS